MKRNNVAAFKWQPFSLKQKKVLTWWTPKSPYKDHDMIICDGSIRSGKTISMIDSFITWATHTFEHGTFIIAGKSMGALKRNVLQPLFEILRSKNIPYHYNRSEHFITIGTNTFYCFGANNEASQDVLQGLTAAGAYADEVALFPKSFVDQMIGRCSVPGSKIWMNCNPESPFHYIKEEFIDKAEEKRILHLHFTLDDNLSLSNKVKERYKRMFSGVFYQRYVLGLWVRAQGIIYDMFDEKKHIVKTIDRPYTKYYIAVDYGTQNPTAFGLWGFFDGVWYKVKEYHHSGKEEKRQKTDVEYSKDLKEFAGNLDITHVIVDPSAASFKAQLKQDGFRVKDADNDVINGIRNVATALNNELIKYNDCCEHTKREFASYVWDEKAADRGEDRPVKDNDHHMDSDRYFVNTVLFRKDNITFLT